MFDGEIVKKNSLKKNLENFWSKTESNTES